MVVVLEASSEINAIRGFGNSGSDLRPALHLLSSPPSILGVAKAQEGRLEPLREGAGSLRNGVESLEEGWGVVVDGIAAHHHVEFFVHIELVHLLVEVELRGVEVDLDIANGGFGKRGS